MSWLFDPEIWASLLTLTILEVVLGVDNLVFVVICAERLPFSQQASARRLGLFGALFTRLALLAGVVWLAKLSLPLFTLYAFPVSIRDLIFISGGLFLIIKGTEEIHSAIEGQEEVVINTQHARFFPVVFQIMIFDIIFSLDSVITAVGLTDQFWIMATAIGIAVALMIFASEKIGEIIKKHPTIKLLALSFLLLIGVVLIADGCHFHVPRGYIYFAIGFSIFVEILNNRWRQHRKKNRH